MSQDERKIRLQKLKKIQEEGINPYPSKYNKKFSLSQSFLSKIGTKIQTAGRVMTLRDMGKLCFGHLLDESQKMQFALQIDKIGKEKYKWFIKNIDIGDFIGLEGEVFKTHKGEISILVTGYELLAKALRPLPEKWHGLVDEELRLRKRYLDFITDPELKKLFYRKAIFWQATREFLLKESFIEVETPILETTTGGADAQPFITHHNALDLDLYLRISTGELWQKRLMIAGFEKTFEIGRQFRNEGMSREHLQDYSQMECYWAYADYRQMMNFIEKLYKYIIKKTYNKMKFKINGFTVDFDQDWQEIDYVEKIKKDFNIDITVATKEALVNKLKDLRVDFDSNLAKARLIDILWKQVRKTIAGPAFLINHPVEVSPLAKRNKKESNKAERFQVILAGSEMGNGYSELNDPLDQEERFKEQAKMREAGDLEAQMYDKEFVEALEYGMPPTAGFGFSERLFSFLEDKTARECQIFPLMKPEK